jgi:hypothetical protein
MGDNTLVEHDLTNASVSKDHTRRISFDVPPVVFKGFTEVSIDWGMKLNYSGNYRMELKLSSEEIMHLFKAKFGTELRTHLLDEDGFTVSDELKKRILGGIKLSDLTIGDLAGIAATPAAKVEEPAPTPPASPFRRRL